MVYSTEDLKGLHDVLLMMLKDIDRVCKENNIKYNLCGGTMLGAVRHQGFIPWDDDIDISMLREDYERFINLDKSCFNYGMFIEHIGNTLGYGHVFAKVMLPGTINRERFTENVNCHKNIYIDIFPIDDTTSNMRKLKSQYNKCRILSKLLLLNCNYKFEPNTVVKKFIYYCGYKFSKLLNKEKLYKSWFKAATKYSNVKNETRMVMFACYKLEKEAMPSYYYDEQTEISFEGSYFSCPKMYEEYLTHLYGDFRKLPPKENQIPKHDSLEFSLGDYK